MNPTTPLAASLLVLFSVVAGPLGSAAAGAERARERERERERERPNILFIMTDVARVLDHLDRTGLAENTVVIYTSDQGFFLGDNGLYDKRFMYEPSLRMPLVVRWPGVIQPGTTTDALAINADFAPTFLDIAGQPTPPEMQGRSLVPLMKGEKPADWRRAVYYRYYHDPRHHHTAAHVGVRTETHKLIHFWRLDQWEMYDLTTDPHEQRNLYNDPAQQDVVKKLKQEMARLKRELKDEDQFADEQPKGSV